MSSAPRSSWGKNHMATLNFACKVLGLFLDEEEEYIWVWESGVGEVEEVEEVEEDEAANVEGEMQKKKNEFVSDWDFVKRANRLDAALRKGEVIVTKQRHSKNQKLNKRGDDSDRWEASIALARMPPKRRSTWIAHFVVFRLRIWS